MRKETVYLVTFTAPGAFVAENWTRMVDSSDPRKVQWPENAYAFTMYEREDVVDGDKRYEGKTSQIGPTYYHPDSSVQSLDEVRSNPRTTKTLILNMECNGWKQIVWTRWGNWPQPFDPAKTAILK